MTASQHHNAYTSASNYPRIPHPDGHGPRIVEYGVSDSDTRRRIARRDDCQTIVDLAAPMPPDVRQLIHWRYVEGATYPTIAARLGIRARSVGRRFDVLVDHITSPEYRLFRFHKNLIRPKLLDTATQILVHRRSQRAIAHDRGVNRTTVWREWQEIKQLASLLPLIESEARRILQLARERGDL